MGGWIIGFGIFLITLWSGMYRRIAAADENLEHEKWLNGLED